MNKRLKNSALIVLIVVLVLASGCSSASTTIQYDDIEEYSQGLLTTPTNGSTEAWTETACKDYLGYDIFNVLGSAVDSLNQVSFSSSPVVTYYEDGTVFFGTELIYQENDNGNNFLIIGFNKDNSVTLPGVAFDAGQANNKIGGIDMWLGHSLRYWGKFDDPDTKTDNCYYASFRMNDINYVIVSEGLDEALFLDVLNQFSNA